ncbi:3-isopropylmalate dehydratase small subunit [Candidatus Karelsulcia muelleri]|uniref:3-isopropylmalate dehydratase small subunit n=1 Tax=Candidatus Karelsulcia muelleri TaxID=336810 RepID=UPI002363845E|nr:3-isopropylmalate dehydratase small subunit [Candidatus Karelsulcia muelleri]WDE42217.1 3-isopropylmalate dehydratase small subunit [Candidatus Karelsulcia muelleri]WDR79064.1 3-isopropylmalate dehydratase small subunit [Candidatus Karelsulcia muelleri]
MEKFKTLISRCLPLDIDNIDTDQIIPARFLKISSRLNIGKNFFRDWRYYKNGKPTNFILNNPKYTGEILITGKNFGCGSSREHAVWAIMDYGIKVIISNYFADIFKQNALNNGLLLIELKQDIVNYILKNILKAPNSNLKINLKEEYVEFKNKKQKFEINTYKKKCFLKGYDDIDFLMNLKHKISKFEKQLFY